MGLLNFILKKADNRKFEAISGVDMFRGPVCPSQRSHSSPEYHEKKQFRYTVDYGIKL